MLNIGQMLYTLKEGQSLSSKVNERLQQYLTAESAIFSRYSSIQNIIASTLNDKSEQCGDGPVGFRNFMTILEGILNESLELTDDKKLTTEEVIYLCLAYIEEISQPKNADNLEHISKSLDEVKPFFTKPSSCSFSTAAKLLKKKELTRENMTEILKNIYFGRDYLNISSIIEIRAYIMHHLPKLIDVMPPKSSWKENPGNTFMGLVFSDMPIFKDALSIYSLSLANNDFIKYDFSICTEEAGVENFNFVLSLAYCRYLIGAFIFLTQCDYSGSFDNRGVERWLIKAYRRYGFGVLTSIYKSFTAIDMMHAVSMIFLDDICTYTSASFTRDRLDSARAIASALSRDIAIKDFSEIIEKICSSAVEQWEAGSQLDHISMLEEFKKNRRYAKYFKERGFERQLKLKLREIMRAKGLHFILGEDVFKRTGNKN